MKQYNYDNYWHYLITQINTNKPRVQWTVDKAFLRAKDIKNIKELYIGKRVLCLGCRHDTEVDDFAKNGFEAKGIDILPTERQIVGDINRLENYFAPGSFDIGYSCHSLEHTNDPKHFLKMVRKICQEGLYLVIPIRQFPDIEEPVFLNVMKTRNSKDLKKEIEPWLGEFEIAGAWVRNNPKLPSGPEMAFALKWKEGNEKWNKVYRHFPGKGFVWTNLDPRYEGASPYIVEKIKKIPKSAKILDAGCGDGRNLVYLTKLGYKISGIDISKEAIKITKGKLKALGVRADLKIGDLQNLPYKKGAFDIVIYDLVNVHIKDPDLVLREFLRVLKKNGLLLFETTSKGDSLYKGKNEFYEKGFYFRFYDRKEAKSLVAKYFKVRDMERNTISNHDHGKGYAARKKHFHKSYLVIAAK